MTVAKIETSTEELVGALFEWERHQVGDCAAMNISRRGMKSWQKLDRNRNLIHYELEEELYERGISTNALEYDKTPSIASAPLPEIEDVTRFRKSRYFLEDNERAAVVAYWNERLAILNRLSDLRLHTSNRQRKLNTQIKKCTKKTNAILEEILS